jgi:ketosteroid isomerase-like protein
VELMRHAVEALSRRDVDALVSFVAPDAAWDLRSGTFEGAEAIRGFLEEWLGSYDDYRVEARRFSISAAAWCFSPTGRTVAWSAAKVASNSRWRRSSYG